ncbi:MAG: ribulose-phosphate 3-epimerase [Pirellulales bacterium]|nr:ribulose-phosphate 3-epimerase [Pirellulales bacterium]
MSRREQLAELACGPPLVLPSLLLCDFTCLRQEMRRLEEAGVQALHLDVMDGQFVPNFTYGLTVVHAVRQVTSLPLDVHLMMVRPHAWIESFRQAGADAITVHIEAEPEPREVLAQIRSLGAMAGLALNPETPLSSVMPYLSDCDLVLVMSVQPGFGGQVFDGRALEKLRALRADVPAGVVLEVDGGVNEDNIEQCVQAGASWLVAGSAIFDREDYPHSFSRLSGQARRGMIAKTSPCSKLS